MTAMGMAAGTAASVIAPSDRLGNNASGARRPALFKRYPHLEGRVPFTPLGSYPTPVEAMPALSARLGAEVWVKRDDLAGPIYGGNKVRKLELVLADALAAGARRVWTIGGIGSHQVLATAIYARELGLGSAAVVFPQPVTPHVREVLRAIVEAGCALTPAAHMFTVPTAGARLVAAETLAHGRAPFLVPPGSSNPSGALGYVSAALELAEQIRQGQCPLPGAIVTAYGSAGTAAGLLVGLRLAGLDVPVYPVRVVIRALGSPGRLAALCRETAARLDGLGVPVPGEFAPEGMGVVDDQVGAGYGYPTEAGREAVSLAAEDGLHLETTYTGKALAGLMALVRERRPGWQRVLFWNTFNSRPLVLRTPIAAIQERLPRALRGALD